MFGLRVLVCGGRDYHNMHQLFDTLDGINFKTPITWVIHGNARGADTLAGTWAKLRGVGCTPVSAEWSKYGSAAGPIRNKRMLGLKPDLVVAFPGGKGTRNMIKQARKAAIDVLEVECEPKQA